MRTREPELITAAELRNRLQEEMCHTLDVEGRDWMQLRRRTGDNLRSYRKWLAAATEWLDAGGDPNTVIATWAKARSIPGWGPRHTRFWRRRPTDAVVIPDQPNQGASS